eukprot:RCo008373
MRLTPLKDIDCGGVSLDAFLQQHRDSYVPPRQLNDEARRFLAEFEAKEKEEQQRLDALKSGADAEGWQTVVPKKRRSVFHVLDQNRSAKTNLALAQLQQKRIQKGKKHLQDFYSFQQAALKAKRMDRLARQVMKVKKTSQALMPRKFNPV